MNRFLYHHSFCGNSRFFRLLCAELDIKVELIKAEFWHKEFLQISPGGRIPVLVENDGKVVFDPLALFFYLHDNYNKENKFWPNDTKQKNLALFIFNWFIGDLHKELMENLVYPKTNNYFSFNHSLLKKNMDKLNYVKQYLENLLQKNHWLVGQFSYVDLLVAAHFSCFDYFSYLSWDKFPELKIWYGKMKSRPTFRPLLLEVLPFFLPHKNYTNLDF